MKLGFFMSHHRKNSVKDKVTSKKWIYLERYTFPRQKEVRLKGKNDLGRNTPQTVCGPSQKVRGPQIWGG